MTTQTISLPAPSFAARGWNKKDDLPLFLRRGISGIYISDQFPGDHDPEPTCIEDCQPGTRRKWLDTLDNETKEKHRLKLVKCYLAILTKLSSKERQTVTEAMEEVFGDMTIQPIDFLSIAIITVADRAGISAKGSEAQTAYHERTERDKRRMRDGIQITKIKEPEYESNLHPGAL